MTEINEINYNCATNEDVQSGYRVALLGNNAPEIDRIYQQTGILPDSENFFKMETVANQASDAERMSWTDTLGPLGNLVDTFRTKFIERLESSDQE
jgi:hypothetical protein